MQDLATSEGARHGKSKYVAAAVIALVLALFGGYLWWISGVLPVVERFPNGKPQTTGYVKRYGTRYEKTGRWTTFYADERKASEGLYERGQKVPESWHYWDSTGKELDSDVADGSTAGP